MHDAQGTPGLWIDHFVGVGEALANLVHDIQRSRDGQPLADSSAPLDQALQVDAVHVLHDDEVRVFGMTDIEDLDDVRVLQRQRQPRLVQEHRDEFLVLGQRRQDALDRDVLLEAL